MPLMISLGSQLSLVIPGGHRAAVPASFGTKLFVWAHHSSGRADAVQCWPDARLDPGLMHSLAFFTSAYRISVCLL